MPAGEEKQRNQAAEESEEHVALGVVDVALRAEEVGCTVAQSDGREPFDDLIDRGDEPDNGNTNKPEPHFHPSSQLYCSLLQNTSIRNIEDAVAKEDLAGVDDGE